MQKKKNDQLGMSYGTATNRLRKNIMFALILRGGLNTCHQCGEKIHKPEELSIEHKTPWLDSEDPVGLFFDLNNISFSHLSCNVAASRPRKRTVRHGTNTQYDRGCRCSLCHRAKSVKNARRNRSASKTFTG